jgi:hypothetical protein
MAEAASRKTNTPATQRAPVKREVEAAPHLTVRYWKRMRIKKVYPVVVRASGEGDSEPLTLRLVMAGAQVVPAEHAFDPANPGESVTFYVTPIANGNLRGERLEVLKGGRKVQEIRLPSRVTSQAGTWVWIFLALFIPWLMLHYLEYAPIGWQNPVRDDGTLLYVSKPWTEYKSKTYKGNTEELLIDRPSRRITDFIKNNTPDLRELASLEPKTSTIAEYYEDAQMFPEKAYLHLFINYHDWKLPLPFILFVVFMIIAFISFLARTQATRRVYGKPLPA